MCIYILIISWVCKAKAETGLPNARSGSKMLLCVVAEPYNTRNQILHGHGGEGGERGREVKRGRLVTSELNVDWCRCPKAAGGVHIMIIINIT